MSALDRIYEAAAEARAAGVAAPTDRPRERRADEQVGTPPIVRLRAQSIQLDRVYGPGGGEAGSLHFRGFASVYDTGYEMWDWAGPYTEQVISGAGKETLARDDLDVPLVLAHDSMRRIARTTNGTLTLSEETVDEVSGLLADAPSLDPLDADVAYIAPKLETGLIDEMSFRFRIEAGSWSPDWMEYHIERYDIHRGDVAIVGYGANPHTQGAGLRGVDLEGMTDRQLLELENKLHALRKTRGQLDTPTRAALSTSQREAMAILGLSG